MKKLFKPLEERTTYNWLNTRVFGKWPWCKQDNALLSVHYQKLMEAWTIRCEGDASAHFVTFMYTPHPGRSYSCNTFSFGGSVTQSVGECSHSFRRHRLEVEPWQLSVKIYLLKTFLCSSKWLHQPEWCRIQPTFVSSRWDTSIPARERLINGNKDENPEWKASPLVIPPASSQGRWVWSRWSFGLLQKTKMMLKFLPVPSLTSFRSSHHNYRKCLQLFNI